MQSISLFRFRETILLMAYLYAGLGVALIIPLMALVQTLVSLAALEGEAGFLRARRLELLNLALVNFENGLNQAMAASPPRLQASLLDDDGNAVSSSTPACSALAEPDQPISNGLDSIQWLGRYPHCSAVVAEVDDKRGIILRLRVEMGVAQDQGRLNRDLPDPVDEVKDSEGKIQKQVRREALRVRRSCWVSLASQGQECT